MSNSIRSKPAAGEVIVWGLRSKRSGRLKSEEYRIGKRDCLFPEWWPTRAEAALGYEETGEEKTDPYWEPVAIRMSWTALPKF